MTAQSILKSKGNAVYTIESGRMLSDAAALLAGKQVGALVVIDSPGEVRGIVGEREIVAAIARGGAAVLTQPVLDHMTRDFRTCRRSDSIEALMEMMTEARLRHIPVVEDGRLIGIVSIGDVVKRRIADSEHEARALHEYITRH